MYRPLYPRGTIPSNWIGGWVGSRAGLNDVEKRKFLALPGLELRSLGWPARSQSLYRLRYPDSWVCRCRWENNIKMNLKEIGWEDVHWVHLAQDRAQWHALVNTVMQLHFRLNTGISWVAEQLLVSVVFHSVHTTSGAHPASYSMGTRGIAARPWSWPFTSIKCWLPHGIVID
jgi:hypothetical protein